MTLELTLPLAFLTGLLGAGHCLGMCGGLAGGWFLCRGQGLGALLVYHGARLLTYGALGMAGALAGRVLVQQGLLGKGQGLVMMAAGLVICLLGLGGIWRWARPDRPAPGAPVVWGPPRPRGRTWQAALAGAGNGLMPCSLNVTIAMAGAATADPVRAGLLMLAFGLGTLPAMALVSLLGMTLNRHARGTLVALAGTGALALGLWTLYEGWVFFDVMRGLSN